ncbi:MAG: helix-turn-helix domain-containing protein [Clostridia bacterium]|nr:helix-turn-helix domain-containing protein [Clostridia bacterium]
MPSAREMEKRYHLDRCYLGEPRVFGSTRLFQIGRLYCAEGMEIPAHGHLNWFELTVVTDGAGTVLTNGVGVPMTRGEIYLSFPGDFHAILSDERDPLKYDFFSFNTTDAGLAAELEALMRRAAPAEQRVFSDEHVRYLVANAIAELSDEGAYTDRILSHVLEEIVLSVLRNFDTMSPPRYVTGVGKQEELCYRMMHYIDTHIYTMQGLGELSTAMCYNYSYLSDVFCRVTSDTLLHYYRARRLEAARLLLLEGRRVSEVAELLHYASVYTFSRAFKEAHGKAPAHYRQEALRAKS